MSTSITLHKSTQINNPVADCLQDVLANTYGLLLMTHNYHWNVEGKQFFPLHKMLEEQYNELFLAVDLVAERIRALNEYALPFEGENIVQNLKMISNPLNKETDAQLRSERMVHNLIDFNEAIVKECQIVKKTCLDAQDDETENMMVERITKHQKAMWMLRSTLK